MIKRMLKTPGLTILLSIIPGLAVWFFGKRRLAAAMAVLVVSLAVLFAVIPSLLTWYPLSILYIGQMVYSAGLSIWRSPGQGKREIGLNSGLSVPLPEKLAAVKQLDQAVFEALARGIRPDVDLTVAILGLDTKSFKYKFLGVTENDLVIAESTAQGDPRTVNRIPKSDVAWVSLLAGERNSLMTIKFEEERFPSINLKIPGKLKKKAIEFVKEFPGTWNEDRSAVEALTTVHRVQWQPRVLIISAISLLFIFTGEFMDKKNLVQAVLSNLSIAVGFFILGWPFLLWLLREIMKDPAYSSANILRSFFIIPSVLYVWYLSVSVVGRTLILFLK